jgi:hypothetical protein
MPGPAPDARIWPWWCARLRLASCRRATRYGVVSAAAAPAGAISQDRRGAAAHSLASLRNPAIARPARARPCACPMICAFGALALIADMLAPMLTRSATGLGRGPAMGCHTLARGAGADRDGRMPPLPRGVRADRDRRMPPLPGVFAPIAIGECHPCPRCSRRSRWADASLSQGVRGDRDGLPQPCPGVFAPIAMGCHSLAQGCSRRSRWADPNLAQGVRADRDRGMRPLPRGFAPIAMGGCHPWPGCSRRSRWVDATLAQGVRADRDGRMPALPRVFAAIAMGGCHPCPGGSGRSRWVIPPSKGVVAQSPWASTPSNRVLRAALRGC